jgi:hypothetical protein
MLSDDIVLGTLMFLFLVNRALKNLSCGARDRQWTKAPRALEMRTAEFTTVAM